MADWTSLLGSLNSTAIGVFGREVSYVPSSGDAFTIRAIVETAKQTEEIAPGVYAAMFLRSVDLPKPPERGDEVSIDGTLYKVFDIEADGGGGIVLRLRQV
ncbi:MAG: hypothetical protein HY820_15895 [Acidobacteria bacterium]|nr:hypothetical protein [Acidobacteriota bacterium]